MKIIKKILYLVLALSLTPIMVVYFAYGSTYYDLIFLGITLLWGIGLLLATFIRLNSSFLMIIFIIGSFVFGNISWGLRERYSEGSDPLFTFLFTIQSILMLVVLWFLLKESKVLRKFSKMERSSPTQSSSMVL